MITALSKKKKITEIYSKRNKAYSFYWYFRPIAIICLCLGVLPLKNLNRPHAAFIESKFLSFPTLTAIGMFLFNLLILVNYSGFPFLKNENSDDTMFVWRCIVIYLMVVRAIMCFLFCLTHSRKIIKLLKILDIFEKKRRELTRANPKDGLKRLCIWTIFPLTFCTSLLAFIAQQQVQFIQSVVDVEDNFTFLAAICFGILAIWQLVPLFLYTYFAQVIRFNFNIVNLMIVDELPIPKSHVDEEPQFFYNIKSSLVKIRKMHVLMSDAVKNINISYGSFLAIDQIYVIVMLILNVYVLFFTGNTNGNLLMYTVFNIINVLTMIYVSHDIREKVSKTLLHF